MIRPLLLRRTGRRPLRFAGEILARGIWRLPGQGAITLGLYASADGGFVCESALEPPSWSRDGFGCWPVHNALSVAAEDDAARHFETLATGLSGTDPASLALALALRAALNDAAGAFLHALATGATTEMR